jgi:Integrase core domain
MHQPNMVAAVPADAEIDEPSAASKTHKHPTSPVPIGWRTRKDRHASGSHALDKRCKAFDIEHRLSPPRHPQTNGMVERFNGRISEVVKQTRFASAAELASTLNNHLQAYNHHIPQRALGHVSPVDALKTGVRKNRICLSREFTNTRNLTCMYPNAVCLPWATLTTHKHALTQTCRVKLRPPIAPEPNPPSPQRQLCCHCGI